MNSGITLMECARLPWEQLAQRLQQNRQHMLTTTLAPNELALALGRCNEQLRNELEAGQPLADTNSMTASAFQDAVSELRDVVERLEGLVDRSQENTAALRYYSTQFQAFSARVAQWAEDEDK